jgi:hypothetical protein
MQQLNKRGHFVIGFIVGALFATTTIFFSTHHTVVDKETCRWSADANAEICDFHYERNK